MAISKAQKKAVAKYETKVYDKTLIRLPKGRLDEIRAHIQPAGESLNGFIGRAIVETMARDGGRGPQEAAEGPSEAVMVFLPSDTIKVAQMAAEAAGESLPQFITRAVSEIADRDKLSRDS